MTHELLADRLETVPLDRLVGYPGNPRRGDIPAIRASLDHNGQYRPLIARRRRGGRKLEVLAGNQTLKAARLDPPLPELKVAIIRATDEAAARIVAVDNRTSDLAGYDSQELADLLRGLPDLAGTGYDTASLEAVLADLDDQPAAGETDPDDIPERPPARTQPGDTWHLGPHRLHCGDATLATTIATVMADDRADLFLTDPPYNVEYVGKTAERLTIENDRQSSARFRQFLLDAFTAAAGHLRPGGPAYIWHSDTHSIEFREAMAGAGLEHKQTLVWVKDRFVLGRQDYQWRHEPCLYGWKAGAAHRWFGQFDKDTVLEPTRPDYRAMTKAELIAHIEDLEQRIPTDVLHVDRPSRSEDHPTTKPTGILTPLLQNSTVAGNIVLDPFAGAGSTLIAAHQLGRHARLVELDPHYCDVTLERYAQFTGEEPTRP